MSRCERRRRRRRRAGRAERRARPGGRWCVGDGAGGARPGRRPGGAGDDPRRTRGPARRRGGRHRHTAYLGLVAELGLTLVPSYVAEPGEITRQVPGRSTSATGRRGAPTPTARRTRRSSRRSPRWCADRPGRRARAPRAAAARPAQRRRLAARGRRDAGRIGSRSSPRSASPTGRWSGRACSPTRARSRSAAATASYDYEVWENQRVAEGSATVALRMADGLADVRLSTPVAEIAVDARGCACARTRARCFEADAVVLAVPAGPARDLAITGVSDARLASLHRQRHAWAAKFVAAYDEPFWRATGQNALSECEGVIGSTWPQQEGVLSALVPPERYAAFAASEPATRTREALADIAALYGHAATRPAARPGPGSGAPTRGRRATSPAGDPATWRRSGRCTAPTSRRSTCAAPTSGSPATWKARSAPGGPRPEQHCTRRHPDGLRTDRRAAQHRAGDARLRRARALPARGGGRAHRRPAPRAPRPRSPRRRSRPASTPRTCPRRSAAPGSTR